MLNPTKGEKQLPPDIEFDLVFSQNKFGHHQVLSQFSRYLHLPLISLEHTLPHPSWPPEQVAALKQMRGHVNVFISEYSREKWGWSPSEAVVIHHGVDTTTFSPLKEGLERKNHLLSVVNDWINRDWCCGFNLWREVSKGLPVAVVGATPGLSEPTKDVADLVSRYRESQIFLNTSLISPIPTALLEAMSCGCAIVSTATAMIPEVIQHGVNGLISNDPRELAGYCRMLLNDPALCRKLGEAARKTILERFSMDRFVSQWDRIFRSASNIIYTGEY